MLARPETCQARPFSINIEPFSFGICMGEAPTTSPDHICLIHLTWNKRLNARSMSGIDISFKSPCRWLRKGNTIS